MRRLVLPSGHVALVDDLDYERVVQAGPWSARPSSNTTYVQRNVKRADGGGTTQALHVFLLGCNGVDHRNGDGLDNQRSNLRVATSSQNSMNRRRRSDNRAGFKGVTWDKHRNHWQALIYAGGKKRHVGYYDTPEAAARGYDAAARELFGEFARPNFPQEISA